MSEFEQVSKSALKREMHALQDLGTQLTRLSARDLATIELPDALLEAIQLMSRLKSREARRRQLQLIGKLMRQVEPEPLRQALQQLEAGQRQQTTAFHAIEALRQELIEQGDPAIQRLLRQYPAADRSQLRQLVRAARKPGSADKRASRKLFRYLKELQTAPPQAN